MSFFRLKKVLITGGLGFIGSNLARRLTALGADVTIVDSMIPGYGGNLFNIAGIRDKVNVNISDIRDPHSMKYLVQGQDYIFNLAGQVSHIDSMVDPITDLDINCRAQLSLLEACRHNNPRTKILYAGTRQVYGKPRYLPVDEEHPIAPADVNGINKIAAEWYHALFYKVYGLRTSCLRLTNVYGPRQLLKHNRQGFIGWFIRQAIDGEEIQLFGTGQQLRDLNFVEDVIDAFLVAAEKEEADGQVFGLGHPEPVSLLQLAQLLLDITGRGSYRLVPFPPDRAKIDIGDVYGDYSKIQKTLGWEPKVGLREGLSLTVEHYRQFRRHYWA